MTDDTLDREWERWQETQGDEAGFEEMVAEHEREAAENAWILR